MLTCRATGNRFRTLVGLQSHYSVAALLQVLLCFGRHCCRFPWRSQLPDGASRRPHCCGRRQCVGTGDVAPVSPAQVQKTSASSVLRPTCLRAKCLRTLPRSNCARDLGSGLRLCFVPVLHQSDRPSFTSRRVTEALLPRPSQSDSRVVAHNERVVGNGCHTASSTRTSPGVPALQGFTSSTLLVRFYAYPPNSRLAPDFAGAPFTCLLRSLAVPACASTARRESSSQGLNRWASRLIALGPCERPRSSSTPS